MVTTHAADHHASHCLYLFPAYVSSPPSCLPGCQVKCPAAGSGPSHQCVWASSLCDGTKDCPQGSDEDPEFCSAATFNCSESNRVRATSLPLVPSWQGRRLRCTPVPHSNAAVLCSRRSMRFLSGGVRNPGRLPVCHDGCLGE